MAFPMAAPAAAAMGPLNPIETIVNGFNTNPYFIGLMMIVMNLGGRHLAGGLTPEQDKIFQHPWVRRALLFVVIFVATRNLFTALWLSVGLVLVIGYLTNETSALYLFGKPKKTLSGAPPASGPAVPGPMAGLTGEEQEILRRLQEKAARSEAEKGAQAEQVEEITLVQAYPTVMKQLC
jgi:hypothetical protein